MDLTEIRLASSEANESMQAYSPLPGVYDELSDETGISREKYKFILQAYADIGDTEIGNRRRELDRILKESGVTFNIYGSADAEARPRERLWSLDLMPLLMESAEFSALERGLLQRAELMNALFKDIYGERRLLFEKIVPPEVVFSAQGYLRSCYGLYQNYERELLYFSTDIARRTNGEFVVLGDRAQAPSGMGYALENRIALSRVFPSLYRDSEVHRVAMFFRTMRKTLASLAKTNGRDPVIVLLTPGPGNETYSEHVFLAGYLGYTLAQATDLTVRGAKLYIKTVEGNQQVDVVFKRTDDFFMDPLELKGDSLLGIPGLVEVVRNGNVAVANPLGAAVLENRTLAAYASELVKFYFGEELILPNAETFYLGDAAHLKKAMQNLSQYIIKPAGRAQVSRHLYPGRMTMNELADLKILLAEKGHEYIAQEIVPGSSVPVFDSSLQLIPSKCVIRTFQIATESGYQVMPGGLARVSTRTDELIVTNQSGAGSKDIWILASEPQKEVSLLVRDKTEQRISRRASGGVPSRIADNIFWMARYAERAENLSRYLRNTIAKITQTEDFSDFGQTQKLLKMLTHITGEYPGFIGDDSAEHLQRPEKELTRLIFDKNAGGSVRSAVLALVRTSENLRDNLSDDMRRVILGLSTDTITTENYSRQHAHLFDVIIHLSAVSGLSQESMSREVGWHFLELGRRLERATFAIRVLKAYLATSELGDKYIIENLLNINDIRITYTRRYRHKIQIDSVLDILLFDESNPRSVGFQLARIRDMVVMLPARREHEGPKAEKISLKLYTAYKTADLKDLLAGEAPAQKFGSWLDELSMLIADLNYNIAETYFTYVEEQVSFAANG